MIMMPEEGIVCFIVFLDNKNIWFGEKMKSLSQLLRCYDNLNDFMADISNCSFKKNPLRMKALHLPRYPCAIKRETNFYKPKQGHPH